MTAGDARVGSRIWILGCAGAGKTTLAREVSRRTGFAHHQLDALFWGRDWHRSTDADFARRVADVAATDSWVIDGQYRATHPILSARADTVVWLEVPNVVAGVRLLRRSVRDFRSRRALYNGNRQSIGKALALLSWAVRVHPRVRRTNLALTERLTAAGTPCHVLRSDTDRVAFLSHVPPDNTDRGHDGA